MPMLNETSPEDERTIEKLKNDVNTVFREALFSQEINPFRCVSIESYPVGPGKQAADLLMRNSIKLKSTVDASAAQLMWTPYAAFYGETNAGKSTLIEALRLCFGEKVTNAGISIGDGRSDYTMKATFYTCNFRGRIFTIIDVPGIEGKESTVEDAIKSALARSQIVFYVTPDARPPQGGENGREGTLEKMARQLKPQAKVWAIWNKKIHSYRGFKKPLLVEGSDEWGSLHEGGNSLDAKMREILGARYQDSLPVSARPAFLALAAHLAPDSDLEKERSKFLEHFSATQLRKVAGIDQVVELIINGIPDEADIREANFNKLAMPIRDCAEDIAKKAKTDFLKPVPELEIAIRKLKLTLSEIAGDAHRNLSRLSQELIQKTIVQVRSKIMEEIESGIDSDRELKKRIEFILENEKDTLSKKIDKSINENIMNTQKSCREAIDLMKIDFEQENAFSISGFSANFDHTIEINTKSNIDWTGLCTSVAAGALAVFLTGGWILVLGLVGTLMGMWNALATWFDPQHKKEQQKKALNNKLLLLERELSASVPMKMNAISNDIAKVVHSHAHPFEKLCENYYESGQILLGVSRKLAKLSQLAPHVFAA